MALVLTACATKPAAVSETPAAQVSPTIAASPTPVARLEITSLGLHGGEIGLGYAPVSPRAGGGVPPYAWSVSDGSLPGGLAMSASGKVTGTPNSLGSFLFTVQVADSAGAIATVNSSISVSRRVVVTGNPCTVGSPCSVEAGCLTVCGLFGFLSGGVAPFKYQVASGAIPTGMALNGFSLAKAFPAPPTTSGKDWTFTVRVTDGLGATAQTTAKFHVYPHIAFTGALTATCGDGKTQSWLTGCNLQPQLAYLLGTPGLSAPKVRLSLVSGQPIPPGMTFTAQGGTVTMIPSQTNCPHAPYQGTVRLVLEDTSTCAANKYCASNAATIKVNLAGC